MTAPATYRQWVHAEPVEDNRVTLDQFALRERPMPEPGEGEALVRIRLINVHSATRQRMTSGLTPLGETDRSNYACAEVIRSRDPVFKEGDVITCQTGWQDYQLVRSSDSSVGYGPIPEAARAVNRTNSQWAYVFRPELVAAWSPDILMDIFGTSGLTAWFGMRECAPVGAGQTVVVAGVTGSVGSIVAQLARIAGAHVIGIAGGEQRCVWAKETLGLADCVDYRAPDLADRLRNAAPDGIDVFSDGVAGPLTALVCRQMKGGGRLFAYGSGASLYADEVAERTGTTLRHAFGITDEIEAILTRRGLRAECWIVSSFYQDRLMAEDALAELMRSGMLKPISTVARGFDKLPEAIVALYRDGDRTGKLQIDFEHVGGEAG